jgi:5-methylcytosine-specific restriction endonuclease McrA
MSEDEGKKLRSISSTFPYPSVIKIKKYVSVPFKGVILNRNNILKRDNHKCQYCGSEKDLTMDHLTPRSKGGKSTWTNLVTACKPCNISKGHLSPEEVGLILRKNPTKPSYMSFIKSTTKQLREDWKPFLERKAG